MGCEREPAQGASTRPPLCCSSASMQFDSSVIGEGGDDDELECASDDSIDDASKRLYELEMRASPVRQPKP